MKYIEERDHPTSKICPICIIARLRKCLRRRNKPLVESVKTQKRASK